MIALLLVFFSLCVADRHGEAVRKFNNAMNAETVRSAAHFRTLFDEEAKYFFHHGNKSPNDRIAGVENIAKSFAMWFPAGGDNKASIDLYIENDDHSLSFITGTYEFTLPSKEHTAYKWSAVAHWAGDKVIHYELYGDFTHCINTIKNGKLLKDEL